MDELEELFSGNMGAALENEQSKGEGSSVPEDTMAGISAFHSLMTKGGISRDDIDQAVQQGMGSVAARKVDILNRLKNGQQMTNSQAVGLGILAVGLLAAGGIAGGKRGIGKAGEAFGEGGKIYLALDKSQRDAETKSTVAELKNVNAEEAQLQKIGLQNKLAPIENQEKLDLAINKKKAGAGDGVTVNIAPGKISTREAQQAAQTSGIVNEALSIAAELRKMPSNSLLDTAVWQGKRLTTATEEGKLAARAFNFAKERIKVQNPGNPSEWEGRTGIANTIGDRVSSPADMATLLEQAAGVIAKTTAANLSAAKELRDDYSGYIGKLENVAKSVGIKDGNPDFVNSLVPSEDKEQQEASPQALTKAPSPTPTPHVQNGKRGVVINGVFHPYKKQ